MVSVITPSSLRWGHSRHCQLVCSIGGIRALRKVHINKVWGATQFFKRE